MQEEALAAIGKVRDARRARILQSRSFIGPGQWLVVLALYFHVLLLISTVHIKRPIAMAVALWMFSSAFAICFVLLLMYDRPFRYGGLTVGPVQHRDAGGGISGRPTRVGAVRAHQEADAEDCEGREQRGGGIAGREKIARNHT